MGAKSLLLATFFLSFTLCANATTLDVSESFFGELNVAYYFIDGDSDTDDDHTGVDAGVNAGEFDITFLDGSKYVAYCVDLYTPLTFGTNDIDDHIAAGGSYATVAWLMDTYAFDNGDGYWDDSGEMSGIKWGETVWLPYYQTAALQLVIWEYLYDELFKYKRDSVNNLTNLYYDYFKTTLDKYLLSNESFDASGYSVVILSDSQNLLVSSPVPEPATFILFGVGLLGIGAVSRKRS